MRRSSISFIAEARKGGNAEYLLFLRNSTLPRFRDRIGNLAIDGIGRGHVSDRWYESCHFESDSQLRICTPPAKTNPSTHVTAAVAKRAGYLAWLL